MPKLLTTIAATTFLVSSIHGAQAQAMSKNSDTNPTTQGYATSGAALKDQHSTAKSAAKKRRAAANQAAPGNSAAETAGAATPNDISHPEKTPSPAH